MHLDQHLTAEQRRNRKEFRSFADAVVAPRAAAHDREEALPRDVVAALGAEGYLAATVPREHGGAGLDAVSYGLLTEELGRACSSVRNLVAVQDMVAFAIWRWGSAEQKARWLPDMAAGRVLAAFALTEPGVGSDAAGVATTATPSDDGLVVEGRKRWISFGEIADLFLVFARHEGRHTAVLVERDTPGVSTTPVRGLLGLRASMLADLRFEACAVPAGHVVGRPGLGLDFVASSCLDLGRYSTAWGCVGLAQACFEAAARRAGEREQYGVPIRDHQLVQRMLADLVTGTVAARLLCYDAGVARSGGEPDALNRTLVAKYFASTTARRAAGDAVQVHGAQGVGESSVQRYYRDAKVMEIIEGTTEIHQSIIGRWAGQAVR